MGAAAGWVSLTGVDGRGGEPGRAARPRPISAFRSADRGERELAITVGGALLLGRTARGLPAQSGPAIRLRSAGCAAQVSHPPRSHGSPPISQSIYV